MQPQPRTAAQRTAACAGWQSSSANLKRLFSPGPASEGCTGGHDDEGCHGRRSPGLHRPHGPPEARSPRPAPADTWAPTPVTAMRRYTHERYGSE
ncbi:hypothetical protein COCSUDRAFT_59474 [Coccomyxa subellipsoidea C-169]|uniref:Uncharacterized protein n=1 Tax=Coccomyxa subellipsoidea (strain C-169) TaxID=574566 RepID=I0Z8L2_COCSC|nr:hypothetical protein COCSUDRAFT_59474 [Coccomyxa subellipsoidea C-169]EIE26981.1 hypothetical protein COCSUDRAFT_59474 [Coccomyxa subellipsoidea C-169]|eukprot:XP_005651525.1 hypothetical protein COCSUDRAFT_59474 [Coccomyxa subellipsoidea C-169]